MCWQVPFYHNFGAGPVEQHGHAQYEFPAQLAPARASPALRREEPMVPLCPIGLAAKMSIAARCASEGYAEVVADLNSQALPTNPRTTTPTHTPPPLSLPSHALLAIY